MQVIREMNDVVGLNMEMQAVIRILMRLVALSTTIVEIAKTTASVVDA